jgi:zinc transporter ZupT
VLSAAGWSVFSSLPQPILAVPAFVFVDRFETILPFALGFAAGAMAWMVGRVLLPEALRECPRRVVVLDTLVAFALMLALQLWLVP